MENSLDPEHSYDTLDASLRDDGDAKHYSDLDLKLQEARNEYSSMPGNHCPEPEETGTTVEDLNVNCEEDSYSEGTHSSDIYINCSKIEESLYANM